MTPHPYTDTVDHLVARLQEDAAARGLAAGTPLEARRMLRESGLLNLTIPRQFGGDGGSWLAAFEVTRSIAAVDSSIAHLLSYHFLGVLIPALLGSETQRDHYYRETVANGWFWANAMNPRDRRTELTQLEDGAYRLDGVKSFCSGSVDSDMLPVTACSDGSEELLTVMVPTRRKGVHVKGDWDCMGQRQTDSGAVTFDGVAVTDQEILRLPRDPSRRVRTTLRACINQLVFTNIYAGIAKGALSQAVAYVRRKAQGWGPPPAAPVSEDPYVLGHFGEMVVQLQAAEALVDRANGVLQDGWDVGTELTEDHRGRIAVAIAASKVAATKACLDISSRMFDVMGARATLGPLRNDRFWRNARTFTLHDAIDYKIRDVGNWALNEVLPAPGFYS